MSAVVGWDGLVHDMLNSAQVDQNNCVLQQPTPVPLQLFKRWLRGMSAIHFVMTYHRWHLITKLVGGQWASLTLLTPVPDTAQWLQHEASQSIARRPKRSTSKRLVCWASCSSKPKPPRCCPFSKMNKGTGMRWRIRKCAFRPRCAWNAERRKEVWFCNLFLAFCAFK